jgi:hypothetical protein
MNATAAQIRIWVVSLLSFLTQEKSNAPSDDAAHGMKKKGKHESRFT